jgi:hypothetical protein
VTKPGGLIATSTRTAYFEQSDYAAVVQGMIDAGKIQLVREFRNGPYTADSTAHYWVYQVA